MSKLRFLLLCALAMATAGAGAGPGRPPAPIMVKIIGLNDYHGNLQSPGTFGANALVPAAERPAVGGAEYLAAYVARLKARNAHSVVVGAGDLVGASPLISALFFDEPAVETLNRIGLAFSAVGNHEFDKGAAELRRLQSGGCRITDGAPDPSSCQGLGSNAPGTFDGARFQWLSANVVEAATGRTLFPGYGIRRFQGAKVAFVGVTLKGTPGLVAPAGVAGLSFRDEARTVNALVPALRARGADAIVLLVHQGGWQARPSVGDINGCDGNLENADGTASEIARIVGQLDDAVDLVISGHTHAAYNCSANTVDVKRVDGAVVRTPRPTGLPNRVGRRVPVTSAGAFGRVLTDIDLRLHPRSHKVLSVSATNRLVDRTDAAIDAAIAADPGVKHIVEGYSARVAPLANAVVGTIASVVPGAANASGEMPAGRLIADAQLQATQPAARGGAVMALMNAGGVRGAGFGPAAGAYPYDVTYGNAFAVQPFGNGLVTMTLTAQQLKDVLEQQFAGCRGQTAQRVMQVSNGLQVAWSASAPACSKIVKVRLTPTDVTLTPPVATGAPEDIVVDGVVQDPARTYRVTVNDFMAAGGDGFTVLRGGADVRGGAQDIDALTAYLRGGYKAPKPAYDPAAGVPRITALP